MQLIEIPCGGDGMFHTGREGVARIRTTNDRRIDLIEYEDKTLCYVKSSVGYPAIYPWQEAAFRPRAEAVLMDLDGTSVYSEPFWVSMIDAAAARMLGRPGFVHEKEDEPFISGNSVTEHLTYIIDKYAPGTPLEEARRYYHQAVAYEMQELLHGRGRAESFVPAKHLKEFLTELKRSDVKIALVTSGMTDKAMPEIVSVFRQLDMGDPLAFYDCIITGGTALEKGRLGTMGELELKPHPWLYAEAACVGLGIPKERRERVLGIEDSAAGVVSIRLAGFACAGVAGGNIREAGAEPLCSYQVNDLLDLLDIVL